MAETTETLLGQPLYRHGNSDILPARSQRQAAAAEQPWTATRCHRQLRPLLAHLAALRRQQSKATAKDASETKHQASTAGKRARSADGVASRKRVRYTYSLKGTRRRNEGPGPAPGVDLICGTTTASTSSASRSMFAECTSAPGQPRLRHMCPGEVMVATPVLSRAVKLQSACSLPSSPILSRGFAKPATPDAGEPQTRKAAKAKCASRYPDHDSLPLPGGRSSSCSCSCSCRCSKNSAMVSMDEEWSRFRKATPPEFRQVYESVFRAVDALLRATAPVQTTKTTTSKSLLAMCLRKLPEYVTACENAERKEAEGRGSPQATPTVAFEMYGDLESFGTETGGWQHLRTAVRAHGIHMVKAACAEGLFHEAFSRLLVRLCTHLQAYAEAEEVLAALVSRSRGTVPSPVNGTGSDHESTPDGLDNTLSFLVQYADETGRSSFLLQQLGGLLACGRLPLTWLSTRVFGRVWGRVLRDLSGRHAPVCGIDVLIDFVTVVVTSLVRARPDNDPDGSPLSSHNVDGSHIGSDLPSKPLHSPSRAEQTLISIMGCITAIAILQQEVLQQEAATEDDGKEAYRASSAARRLSIVVQSALAHTDDGALKAKSRRSRKATGTVHTTCHRLGGAMRRFVLGLACFLSHLHSHEKGVPQSETRTTIEHAACLCLRLSGACGAGVELRRQKQYDATVTLIASIAENCGRGAATARVPTTTAAAAAAGASARDYLTRLCAHVASRMAGCFVEDGAENAVFRTRLLADAAFLLANRTNDLRDLAFAERLACGPSPHPRQRQQVARPNMLPSPASTATTTTTTTTPQASPGRVAPPTALFSGYRWEEGISEWVVVGPASSTEASRHVRPRRLAQRTTRWSLPPSRPTRQPTTTITTTPRTPPRQVSCCPDGRSLLSLSSSDSDDLPQPRRRGSAKGRRRTMQTLLDLVPDDDGDEEGEHEATGDGREKDLAESLRTPPTQRVPENSRPGTRMRNATIRIIQQWSDDITSDDELCR
ncbi:hypothetical protein SPI_08505 [Niveomyces insectorum RCEF 264]|uniref:Uncharacterized protein n=1 Tax=Niveomyces insectorum RCEF 264 TaxID=1081102 RepID=A0A167N130_9HYPO|nr:hypothetical protein SPI_08505 [Niveomyces insectorum RCEF 264]